MPRAIGIENGGRVQGTFSEAEMNARPERLRALNQIYAGHGLLRYRTFGYGHSFGVLCHYDGREAGVEPREDIETVLEPGMVVSIEPMIMLPEGQPHDILVITEDGNRNITGFPHGPEHNIIGK